MTLRGIFLLNYKVTHLGQTLRSYKKNVNPKKLVRINKINLLEMIHIT
jgi:hypothetical protein